MYRPAVNAVGMLVFALLEYFVFCMFYFVFCVLCFRVFCFVFSILLGRSATIGHDNGKRPTTPKMQTFVFCAFVGSLWLSCKNIFARFLSDFRVMDDVFFV